jgi:hypothetical protein
MKNTLKIAAFALVLGLLLPGGVMAQNTVTNTKTNTVNEEVQAALKKSQEEIKKASDESRKLAEDMKVEMRVNGVRVDGESRGGRSSYSGDMSEWYPQAYSSPQRGMARISWDFSRSIIDNSSSKEYAFEVEKEMKSVSMSISGMCKSGEIKIVILMPGSKSYTDVVIDELGNLNWRKSFELNDESQDKIGVWKFKVTTTKATGSFRLSLTAN